MGHSGVGSHVLRFCVHGPQVPKLTPHLWSLCRRPKPKPRCLGALDQQGTWPPWPNFQGLARAPLDVTEEADGCSSCGPPEICHNETPTDDQADDIVLGAIPPSSASPHFSSVSQPLRRATVFPHTSTSGNF